MLLDDVLARVRSGTTKDDDAHWLHWYIAGLRSCLDRAESEMKGMVEEADNMHRECAFWRDHYQRVAYRLEKEGDDA